MIFKRRDTIIKVLEVGDKTPFKMYENVIYYIRIKFNLDSERKFTHIVTDKKQKVWLVGRP